jgi:hypothetical protein
VVGSATSCCVELLRENKTSRVAVGLVCSILWKFGSSLHYEMKMKLLFIKKIGEVFVLLCFLAGQSTSCCPLRCVLSHGRCGDAISLKKGGPFGNILVPHFAFDARPRI